MNAEVVCMLRLRRDQHEVSYDRSALCTISCYLRPCGRAGGTSVSAPTEPLELNAEDGKNACTRPTAVYCTRIFHVRRRFALFSSLTHKVGDLQVS